jgi:hypothetical protein
MQFAWEFLYYHWVTLPDQGQFSPVWAPSPGRVPLVMSLLMTGVQEQHFVKERGVYLGAKSRLSTSGKLW